MQNVKLKSKIKYHNGKDESESKNESENVSVNESENGSENESKKESGNYKVRMNIYVHFHFNIIRNL